MKQPEIRFRITDAIEGAIYSWFAYGQPITLDTGRTTLDEYCAKIGATYEWVTGRPKTEVDCLVVYLKDRVVFAFRGTCDIRGWLVDANIKFRRLHGKVMAHAGFYGTVDAIWLKSQDHHGLLDIALAAFARGLRIYVYGHSKGGAESCQFTGRLADEGHIFATQRISFGEPRSWNHAGAAEYNAFDIPTFRVMDADDVVCRIPFRLGLFRHVGISVFIDAWLNIAIGEPWFAHIISDIYAAIKELLRRKVAIIDDHGMAIYYDRLKTIEKSIDL